MSSPALGNPESGKLAQADRVEQTPTASNTHTLGVIAIILTFAATGRVLVGNQSAETLEAFGRIPIYLVALAP